MRRPSLRTLVIVAACAFSAAPAAAQAPPKGRGPAAATAKGGADAGASDAKKATEHFRKGEAAFKEKKFNVALEEFKTSYGVVPSPNSHLYVARCLVAVGETREAYIEFDKVIAEVAARKEPKYEPAGEAAKVERDELAAKLAFVTVNVKGAPPDATLKIAGNAIPPDQWGKAVPVTPGSAEVVVESGSRAPVSQTVSLAAGDKKGITMDAAPPPPTPEPVAAQPEPTHDSANGGRKNLLPYALVAGGIGVVGLGIFTVAGIMSNSTYSDLKDACKGACPAGQGYDSDISKGKTQQTVANVGLVFGVLGVAAGATLFALSMTGHESSRSASRTRSARSSSSSPTRTGSANASLYVGPGSTGVRGQF